MTKKKIKIDVIVPVPPEGYEVISDQPLQRIRRTWDWKKPVLQTNPQLLKREV